MADLPEDVIEYCEICKKVANDGFVYVEVQKGIYGLTHSGIIAQKLLEELLHKH